MDEAKFELRLARSLAATSALIILLAYVCMTTHFMSRLPGQPLERFSISLLLGLIIFWWITIVPIWRVHPPSRITPMTSAGRALGSALAGAGAGWALTQMPNITMPGLFTFTAGMAVLPLCVLAYALGALAHMSFIRWAQLQSLSQLAVRDGHA